MSKEFFRFLRGELNGYYITRLNNLLNVASGEIKDFLSAFKKMQFNLETMPANVMYGLGTFAGIHLLQLSEGTGFGTIRFTESYTVDGNERSERGLLRRETESFQFEHTQQEDYQEDINTLATKDLKSSMAEEGKQPLGYIASSSTIDEVLDDDGNVKPEVILQTPPSGEAYTDFYGNEFLYLWDGTSRVRAISESLFFELYKVMQAIRYNGVNIKSFAQMVSILCPEGLVVITGISKVSGKACFNVTYRVNAAPVDAQQQRLGLLEYLTELKFPQFTLQMED